MSSTFQFFAEILDQLDLALDQLEKRQANFDRFAMMLIDNAIELWMVRVGRRLVDENDFRNRIADPKFPPKYVLGANSQNFDERVKGLTACGFLDEESKNTLLLLHRFRNTSFHAGERHSGILGSLSSFYLEIVCEIVGREHRVDAFGISSSSLDSVSHRAKKYLGAKKGFLATEDSQVFGAFERIREIAVSFEHKLVDDLHSDLCETIEDTDYNLAFLSENNPFSHSRDEVAKECQVWALAFSDDGRALAKENSIPHTPMDLVPWLRENHRFQITRDPILAWKKRLKEFHRIQCRHESIKKYCSFLDQTKQFRHAVSESAMSLDHQIQMQIDAARGK